MFEPTRHVRKHMEQTKLRKRMEECDSSPQLEASKIPNKRRELLTNLSDELPMQGTTITGTKNVCSMPHRERNMRSSGINTR
jgi:hypothetical protein